MTYISIQYEKSKYKYVAGAHKNGEKWWSIKVPNYAHKRYKTEEEAAKAVDMILIGQGKEPVNILKRKII